MNDKQSLIYVKSPFQFLCALEAIHKFSLKNILLIAVSYGTNSSKEQLRDLVREHQDKFNKIIQWESTGRTNFLSHIKCIKQIINKNFGYYFTGESSLFNDIVLSNMIIDKVFLLDDGGFNIASYNDIKENKQKSRWYKKIRYIFFGLKIKHNTNINFFTFFNLSPFGNSEVFKNRFDYFKKKYFIETKPIDKCIYIIGNPLVESGIVNEDVYREYLNKILNRYKNYKIYYIKHRTEANFINSINKMQQFNIIENTKPGEIFFAQLQYSPEVVVGTFSTMLLSLKAIFSNIEIVAYRFNDDDILINKDKIKQVYEYISNENIKFIF